MSCSSNSLLPSTHASAEMPPPRPPPRRPPRQQAQYAAHALQAHGALPPRPPPADPAVTTAIEVLEASARYAESQIDARSRDAAVDAALGACARALSRGEVPLVAPAAQAAPTTAVPAAPAASRGASAPTATAPVANSDDTASTCTATLRSPFDPLWISFRSPLLTFGGHAHSSRGEPH